MRTISDVTEKHQPNLDEVVQSIAYKSIETRPNQQIVEEPSGDLTTYSWDYENKNTRVALPDGIRLDKDS